MRARRPAKEGSTTSTALVKVPGPTPGQTPQGVHWWNGGWWFYDEFKIAHGPFMNEIAASNMYMCYLKFI